MKSTFRVMLTLAAVLTVAGIAQAESSWSWRNWVPFAPKPAQTVRSRTVPKTEPSAWTKFNRSTKAFFAKTKQAVPSWLMPNTQKRVQQSSQAAKQSSGRVKQEVRTVRRNVFAPWLDREPPQDKPTTVPDWLALPKPE